MKIYCEHNAVTPELRAFSRDGRITLVHFPFDPDSQMRRISTLAAMPSDAQWRDLNTTWDEVTWVWDDFKGSEHRREIIRMVGPANRRDALHVDSAYKSRCAAFATRDPHMLDHKAELEALLGIRVFNPFTDREQLRRFIEAGAEGVD